MCTALWQCRYGYLNRKTMFLTAALPSSLNMGGHFISVLINNGVQKAAKQNKINPIGPDICTGQKFQSIRWQGPDRMQILRWNTNSGKPLDSANLFEVKRNSNAASRFSCHVSRVVSLRGWFFTLLKLIRRDQICQTDRVVFVRINIKISCSKGNYRWLAEVKGRLFHPQTLIHFINNSTISYRGNFCLRSTWKKKSGSLQT